MNKKEVREANIALAKSLIRRCPTETLDVQVRRGTRTLPQKPGDSWVRKEPTNGYTITFVVNGGAGDES